MMDWELISDEIRTSTLIFSYICTIFFHSFLYFPATAHVFSQLPSAIGNVHLQHR